MNESNLSFFDKVKSASILLLAFYLIYFSIEIFTHSESSERIQGYIWLVWAVIIVNIFLYDIQVYGKKIKNSLSCACLLAFVIIIFNL